MSTSVVQEAIGAIPNEQALHGVLQLLATDAHSTDLLADYRLSPLRESGYTYERWIRVQFLPSFTTIGRYRFWMTDQIPQPGWTLQWGSAPDYTPPTNAASSVATHALPTSDPGVRAPNCGGMTLLDDTEVRHSAWIVLQARVDMDTAGTGPIFGIASDGTLIPIRFHFAWNEN